MNILDRKLEYLRRWPSPHRGKILKGPLRGTIGAVDTFPICIPQPKLLEDRKRFFIYKPGHQTRYGYKVQTFVDLHGRILDVTDAHPFGSKADLTLFRESCLPQKLGPTTRAIASTPVTLASRIENRYEKDDDDLEENKHSASCSLGHEPADQKSASIPNISEALSTTKALGDKAYIGSELIYVPHKRYKGKRFTKTKKEFNKLLSSKRVIVENVNKRLEDFKVLGTIYRGRRNADNVSTIVRVLASLHNFLLPAHPLRQRRKRQKLQ
jgi:hypothetical protein